VSEAAIQRHLSATDDPDVAQAYMTAMYAEHSVSLRSSSSERFRLRSEAVVADKTSFGRIQYSVGADVRVDGGVGFPMVMHQHPGAQLTIDHGRRSTLLGPDELFLVTPPDSCAAHWDSMDITAIGLSASLLEEDAGLLTGNPTGPVTFAMGSVLGPGARGHWLQVQRFVARNLATNAGIAASPLARRELLRLLNGATLACFANSTRTSEPDPPGTLSAAPAPVRRAVAHIEEHADEPVELADLCRAAGLGPRSLQAAFRRHLGTSPLGHLRQVRLERVHRELQAAEPGDGQTVAQIATRWGFTQLGRFARLYRERYTVTPSQTLRERPGTGRP
jgi:AraC-like DNA-binding protein